MIPTSFTNFSEIYSGVSLIALICMSLINAVLLYFASLKFILVLQQGGYRYERYFRWISNPKTPYLSRLMILCLLGFLFFNVLSITFLPIFTTIISEEISETICSHLGFISYVLFVAIYIKSESAVNAKVPLKRTRRIVRLSITYCVLLAVITFALMLLFNYIAFVAGSQMVAITRYSLICGMPILCPFILFLAYCLNEPFEAIGRWRYVKIAKHKLNRYKVTRIGITGSYGKTSVKEILRTLLSQRFRVLSTTESYNTPLGIAMTVKNLDSTHDVFLAEMGARTKGDILELTQMVKPTMGVITGINNQHLESFKSSENIKDTKYELFEYLGEKGLGFFSSDNAGTMELYERFNGEKYTGGLNGENNLAWASDIVLTTTGTEFTLNIKGENPIRCQATLLGKHNVANICLASAVAYKMGLTPEEIAEGITRLKSVSHRLELIPNNKGIVLIDDSYNSNENGVKAALDVLDEYTGRKIVLTPGLVELGKEENVVNYEFGKTLASHADIVIIAGKHNAEMLLSGLLDGGMDKANIMFEKSISRGNKTLNEIVSEGDVVLFENDLPDNYN